MLGTGGALVTKCYNTCFVVETSHGKLLCDAGGGNGILVQLEKAGIDAATIQAMFVTHAHTDHILGAVWVIRKMMILMNKRKYNGTFHVYGHEKVIEVLYTICKMTMLSKDLAHLDKEIIMHTLDDGEEFEAAGMKIKCFDIYSRKERQFGFRAVLPPDAADDCCGTADAVSNEKTCSKTLVCLGDEPYNSINCEYVENADWLMHEAFCLYAEKDKYNPYKKSHSTAFDAGRNAAALNVRHLILYHTEDNTLAKRKKEYTAEAAKSFAGDIFVPEDLEEIIL